MLHVDLSGAPAPKKYRVKRQFVRRTRLYGSPALASRKNIAIVALARKLLVTLWAMLRDGTRWREPAVARHPSPALTLT
jgi:hypothetical protein